MGAAQFIYHILGIQALTAKHTVSFKHFPDNTQLYRVIIDNEDLVWKAEFAFKWSGDTFYRLICYGKRNPYFERTAFPKTAGDRNLTFEQTDKPSGYCEAKSEPFGIQFRCRAFKRKEYPIQCFLIHAYACILYADCQNIFLIQSGKTY